MQFTRNAIKSRHAVPFLHLARDVNLCNAVHSQSRHNAATRQFSFLSRANKKVSAANPPCSNGGTLYIFYVCTERDLFCKWLVKVVEDPIHNDLLRSRRQKNRRAVLIFFCSRKTAQVTRTKRNRDEWKSFMYMYIYIFFFIHVEGNTFILTFFHHARF